ncbi:hypothetical protein Hanom_Chr04g00352171 [Helianthus anomalus]
MEVWKWGMNLKYLYMLYVYMCVRRFCPLVGRLERPGEVGEDAAGGGGVGEERRRTGTKGGRTPYRSA